METYHTGNFKHLTLSDRAEIEVMIEKRSPFPRRQGPFPKIPLPSLKKSGGTVSLFPTISSRTAANAIPFTVWTFLP